MSFLTRFYTLTLITLTRLLPTSFFKFFHYSTVPRSGAGAEARRATLLPPYTCKANAKLAADCFEHVTNLNDPLKLTVTDPDYI